MDEIDHRDLRRGKKAYGRTPRAGSSANIKVGPLWEVIPSCNMREVELYQMTEGVDLSSMGMS